MPFFISGDWPFFYPEQISDLSWLPNAYRISWWFGENITPRLWIEYPFRLVVKLFSLVGLPWVVIEKIWLLGIVILCAWSAYQLSSRFFKEPWQRWITSIVYVFNTYFFLVLGGGQLGVAAAFAVFPFALLGWMKLLDTPSARSGIATGLTYGLLIALDLRVAYLCALAFALYCFSNWRKTFSAVWQIIFSLTIAASLHLYWLLPAVFSGRLPMPEEVTGAQSLSFFSVADMSHALGLLHPNWPENLFGKVYFMQPEFLVLPIIAFSALLTGERNVRFFALLALTGAFLAKGVREPFGGVYAWLYAHIPGFIMFRDPTKFYLFVAVSYAMLIPVTLSRIAPRLIVGFFVLLQLFLFRDVFLGKTTHSFQFQPVPKEYEVLKDTLRADIRFSRVLWLPGVPHFAYSDDLHPFVDASHALGVSSIASIAASLADPATSQTLSEKSIGYLVVPTDESKNMFLADYKYDATLRKSLTERLEESDFRRDSTFTNLAVYRNNFSYDLFSSPTSASIQWQRQVMNRYSVNVPQGERSITMRVAFDPGWRLSVGNDVVVPTRTPDGWMRFEVPQGETAGAIYFLPDRAARIGAVISGILLLLYFSKKR